MDKARAVVDVRFLVGVVLFQIEGMAMGIASPALIGVGGLIILWACARVIPIH